VLPRIELRFAMPSAEIAIAHRSTGVVELRFVAAMRLVSQRRLEGAADLRQHY
jgi:hypothetical protein